MDGKIHKSRLEFLFSKEFVKEFYPLIIGFVILICVYLYGLYIFMHIEGWGLLDSFYQVVITLSTVGFREVHEISDQGKLHTSILILLGVGTYAYIIGSFTNAFLEGKIQIFLGKKKDGSKNLITQGPLYYLWLWKDWKHSGKGT